jgi:hypothetical protein
MSITYWRVYFPCPMTKEGSYFVEVSDSAATQLRKAMKASYVSRETVSLVTGREGNLRDSRTLYVDPGQIVALEPRDD